MKQTIMSPQVLPLLVLIGLTLGAFHASCHNITQILASDPDLSQFNTLLSRTKLADEINSRQTITVLALSNSAMSSLPSNLSLTALKNTLSLHVLLDYFDSKKLHDIKDGTVLSTSLYQTTGQADAHLGEVNITDAKGGVVKFGSGQAGAKLGPTFVKEVKTIPFTISVVEISGPIMVSELLKSGSGDVNVTAVLYKAGCKIFSDLLSSSGVLKAYEAQIGSGDGITIFAPNDEAFKAKGVPDLSKLTSDETVSLLRYHALTSYSPVGTLKSTKGNLQTLATAGKYALTTSTAGDSVTLHTGVDSSRIATTLLDATPVAIFSVDSVLLPVALFGMSPSPAPAPAPGTETPTPAPSPAADSPAPASTPAASPPAPPSDTPAGSPDEGSPTAASAAADESKNGAADGNGNGVFLVSVVFGVIMLLF